MKVSAFERSSFNTATDRESLKILSRVLQQNRNLNLFDFKERWFTRRVLSRVRSTHCKDLTEYVQHLQENSRELDRLLGALTIHTSSFFRNPRVFEKIRWNILEDWMVRMKAGHRFFSAWSCGCGQGEEPYSLAMLWERCRRERVGPDLEQPVLHIFANDINSTALAVARSAVYDAQSMREIPEMYREEFMTGCEGGYRVQPDLRRMVRFEQSNVFAAGKAQRFDLILCRNVLIFVDRPSQERLLERLQNSLRNRGYLVLGLVESVVDSLKCKFRAVDAGARIYQKVCGQDAAST